MEVKSGAGISKIEPKRRPVRYTRNAGVVARGVGGTRCPQRVAILVAQWLFPIVFGEADPPCDLRSTCDETSDAESKNKGSNRKHLRGSWLG
jgi:hypothetical protein